MKFEFNNNTVRVVGFVLLAFVAVTMIVTHQTQYLPEIGGAGIALLLFT